MTRRLALFLLVSALLLPYFHSIQADLYVNPTNFSLHAWATDSSLTFTVNVTAVGGEANVTFYCLDESITPPENTTLQAGEQRSFDFTINITYLVEQQVGHMVTNCYVNETAIHIDLQIEEPPKAGQLQLSSNSVVLTAPANEVVDYPALLYITNGYSYEVEVSKALAPSWLDFPNITLLPGETKPLPLTVNTNGLVAGAQYGAIVRYNYDVITPYGDFPFEESFQATLSINSTQEETHSQRTYILKIGVIDQESAEPIQGATVILTWDAGTESVMARTDQSGYVTFTDLSPQTYQYTIIKQGYEQYTSGITVDENKSILVILRKSESNETSVNLTQTTTQTETQAPLRAGNLFIPAYTVNLTVEAGKHNAASIPLVARGGYVNISLQAAYEQPTWITANVTATRLFEGQTAFLVVSASPDNATKRGNHIKEFYLTYNGEIAVITANVTVIEPRQLNRTGGGNLAILAVNGSGLVDGGGNANKVYRPASLQVPLVSVLLRGNEGITPDKPVQVTQNEIVYVIVQGDLNHIKILPKGAALLGMEPRGDGALFKYQIKENGAQLDIRLVYYSPLTGEESYERPSEYGYGVYRFEVVESQPELALKSAILYFSIESSAARVEAGTPLVMRAFVSYPNGTRTNWDGPIQFSCKYDYANITYNPQVSFQAGYANFAFAYAGRCTVQKPKEWGGDFRASPETIYVEPVEITMDFPSKLVDDKQASLDLSTLGIDIYKVEIEPRASMQIKGMKLYFQPKAGTSYTISIYGHTRKASKGAPANTDVVIRYVTGTTEASLTSAAFGTAQTIVAVAIIGFLGWMGYNWLQARARKKRRPIS